MKNTVVLHTQSEWEDAVKKAHGEGKTFGMVSESNRLYRYHIDYNKRLEYLNKSVDVTAYLFIPKYQEWVGMNPRFVKDIYGKLYYDDLDTIMKERFGTTDYMYIPESEKMSYMKEARKIVYELAPLSPYINNISAVQYIKGCYASSVHISLSYKEMLDYHILCPWQLEYNLICHHVSNTYGIKSEFPGFTAEDIINKTDPIPVNYYNYKID